MCQRVCSEGANSLAALLVIFTVMTVRTASTTSHLLAAFRFGLPVAYADDASVGITERIREGARARSEKGSEQGQRRGQK